MCINFGTKVGTLNDDEHVYYDFPNPGALADPSVEQTLRQLGFGYRAKYIRATAHTIAHVKPSGWLSSLRTESYSVAKESLLELSGVGPKVADCVVSSASDFTDIVVSIFFRPTVGRTCGYTCLANCRTRLQIPIKRKESRQHDKRCIQWCWLFLQKSMGRLCWMGSFCKALHLKTNIRFYLLRI